MSSLDYDPNGSSSSNTSSDTPNNQNEVECMQRRKPIPRKGHTKSRRGCFNCKRRRIKCNEKHPQCSHCIKAELQCDYPLNIINTNQGPPAPHPQEVVSLRSTPGMFSMSDMRLFHHFLITAYPHLPVGADKIWVTVVPGFAHNYDYLIHSILALSASHLNAVSSSGTAEQAIQHRILAVKSLNEALSVPPRTQCERDAKMAAALALAFQSCHLDGLTGLSEFLTMIRGVSLIAGEQTSIGTASVFNAFQETGQLQTMKTRLAAPQHLHLINPASLSPALLSLDSLASLPLAPWEQTYLATLHLAISHASSHPAQAYTAFTSLYTLPAHWSHSEFQSFIDPHNSVAQILLAHFIAVQATLAPILYVERVGFEGVHAPTAVLGWVECICAAVPASLRGFVEWPRQVVMGRFTRVLDQGQVGVEGEMVGEMGG